MEKVETPPLTVATAWVELGQAQRPHELSRNDRTRARRLLFRIEIGMAAPLPYRMELKLVAVAVAVAAVRLMIKFKGFAHRSPTERTSAVGLVCTQQRS